jgi:hypothetical protein
MPLTIDWTSQLIKITSPTTDVDAQTLHDFIEDNMASARGTSVDDIINPEGKIEDPNQPGVYSQIILIFNTPWQIQFWAGSGYTRIYGGKIVGGLNDQPMKATGTGGDITVLESPVDGLTVTSGSGVTEQDKLDIADRVWDEVLTGVTHNVPASAGRRLRQLGDVVSGTVVADSSNTNTQFVTNLTEARDDFYNDQLVRFTTGNLSGHAAPILDYDGTNKIIIVDEPMVDAPDDGIEFDIIPTHIHPIEQIVDGVWDALVAGHVTAGSFAEVLVSVGRMTGNKVTMSGDIATIYLDDEVTPWRQYNLANDERIPV